MVIGINPVPDDQESNFKKLSAFMCRWNNTGTSFHLPMPRTPNQEQELIISRGINQSFTITVLGEYFVYVLQKVLFLTIYSLIPKH